MNTDKKPQRKSIAEEYAAEIIRQLKEGTAPWQKPWKAGEFHLPFNPVSGTNYRGVNIAMLALHGYADPRWMTFKQAQAKDWKVKKGSKSQHVVFWQWQDKQTMLDDQGRPVLDNDGNEVKETVDLARPRLYVYNAFHISQIQDEKGNDLPPFEAKGPEWQPNERAEAILRGSGAAITHDQLDRAFYRRSEDAIHLPPRENFSDEGQYYSTALHELCHWTGHENRMNREFGAKGTEQYAKEELRAEIASWMLCQELGLPYDPGQHVAYVDSWVKALEDDPYEIMRACQMAEKIKTKVLDMERGITLEQGRDDQEPGLFNQRNRPDYGQGAGGAMLKVMNDLQLAAELPAVDQLLKTVEAARADSSIAPFEPFSAALNDIETFGREIADSGRDDDHPEFEDHWKAIGGVIKRFELELNGKGKEQDSFLDQEKGKEYEVVPMRRVRSADGDQPRPWKAVEEGKAEFYAVVDKAGGRLVSTSASIEDAEMKAQARRFDGSRQPTVADEKIYLDVPFMEKAIVKELGATWDNGKKSWCARPGVDLEPLSRWIPDQTKEIHLNKGPSSPSETGRNGSDARKPEKTTIQEPAPEKTFLNVPYKEKESAKVLGAKWDRNAGLWYAPEGADLTPLAKYIPEKTPAPAKEISPEAEFAQALEKAGLKIDSLPIIDGKIHRVPVIDGRPGNRDGAYCAYADGRPAGWMMNYRTGGEKVNWMATGQTLTAEQKASLAMKADERRAEREAERQAEQAQAIKDAGQYLKESRGQFHELSDNYLVRKGVYSEAIIDQCNGGYVSQIQCENKPDGKIVIPAYDKDGNLRTFQTIAPDGQKSFAKGCPKAGAMHVIDAETYEHQVSPDPDDPPARGCRNTVKPKDIASPKIYISEGYATGASVYLATKNPVVVAFDANNLKAVAMAIREIHPEANIILCADNDHKNDKNVGLEKAQEAAQAVGGEVIAPEFTKEEKARGLTDFNDLHRARGLGAVRDAFQKRQSLGRATAQIKSSVSNKSVKSAGMSL